MQISRSRKHPAKPSVKHSVNLNRCIKEYFVPILYSKAETGPYKGAVSFSFFPPISQNLDESICNSQPRSRVQASIIIPCRNEGENIKLTVDSILNAKTEVDYEIIIIDDGSEDDCCAFLEMLPYCQTSNIQVHHTQGIGAAAARNYGARLASGNYLIFCDAHITVEPFWLDDLLAAIKGRVAAVVPAIGNLQAPNRVGYGQIWDERLHPRWLPRPDGPLPVPLLPGGCLVVNAAVFKKLGGFEEGFRTWGCEDTEFSLRLWLCGYESWVIPHVKILHLFRSGHPFPVNERDVFYNFLRMCALHLSPKRLQEVFELYVHNSNFWSALTDLLFSDWMQKRQAIDRLRIYDDDWYWHKFRIPF